jgi:hypothetical protein
MRLFCISIPAALLSSSGLNIFADERICVHVYELNNPIPEPLLEKQPNIPARSKSKHYFQSGLPELIVCTSRVRFLDLFQYFWPLSPEEFRSMQEATEVKFAKPEIFSDKDVEELSRYLSENDSLNGSQRMTSAVVLTLNDYTMNWVSEIVQTSRKSNIAELVIFKDPARPPYLCSYPAQQKGFKRPPPIGSSQS